jgi:hypothetical protein
MAKIDNIKVDINYTRLRYILNSPAGPVGREMKKRAEIARTFARAKVGKETGMLAMSLYIEHSTAINGQHLRIGSNLPYALYHHEGTRPHLIHARGAEVLRFTNRGRVVYARTVMHPGTKPNRYLTASIPLIVLK